MTMVCAQVMGNNTAITVANSQGQFELNVFKLVLIKNLLHSITLLANGVTSFKDNCIVGIQANEDRIEKSLYESLMLVTCLNSKIGYHMASEVAKSAHKGTALKQLALDLGAWTNDEFDRLFRPEPMIAPK